MSYASASDLLARYDYRTVSDLVSDYDVRLAASELIGPPVNPNLQAALDDGASIINSALQQSQRYTQEQLAALTATDAAMLRRLNADLSFCFIVQRRGLEVANYHETWTRSNALLDRLRLGELVLNVPGNIAVGQDAIEWASPATFTAINSLRNQASPLYPQRLKQIPSTGGNSFPG